MGAFRTMMICVAVAAIATVSSCGDNNSGNVWDTMPTPISEFVARYFPDTAVDRFVEDNNDFYVNIKNGPEIIFDENYHWITMNGEGEVLPQIFLFDELPPSLYAYLQELDAVGSVYKATVDASEYILTLEDSIVVYNISTGIISQPY